MTPAAGDETEEEAEERKRNYEKQLTQYEQEQRRTAELMKDELRRKRA